MRRMIALAVLAAGVVSASGQAPDNTLYVKSYPGITVGQKLAAAQTACGTRTVVPCILVIDPSLAAWPTGTLPSKCSQCYWVDYRQGTPFLAYGSFTGLVYNNGTSYVVAAASSLATLLSTLTNCNSAGYAYVPKDGQCESVTASGASLSANNTFTGNNLFSAGMWVENNGTSTSSGVIEATITALSGASGNNVPGSILYSLNSAGSRAIYLAPCASATYPPSGTNLTPCVTTALTSTATYSGVPTLYRYIPSSIALMPGGFTTHSGSVLSGGYCVYVSTGGTSATCILEGSVSGGANGGTGLALYSNEGTQQGQIALCPIPATSQALPTTMTLTSNCPAPPAIFMPNVSVFPSNIVVTPPTAAAGEGTSSQPGSTFYGDNPGAIQASDPTPISTVINQYSGTAYSTDTNYGGDTLTPKGYVDRKAIMEAQGPVKYQIAYGTTYTAYGDSITAGMGATSCNSTDTYGSTCYAVDNFLKIGAATFVNRGVGGAESCDQAATAFNSDAPTSTVAQFSMMIGTNDVHDGNWQYMPNTQLCEGAALSWLATESSEKVAGSTFTPSSGTWANYTTFSHLTGTSTTGAGVTAVTLTTNGGPIYIWYPLIDGNTAGFTWQLDSGPVSATVCNYTLACSLSTQPAVHTGLGATASVGWIRIPPPTSGTHTITFTSVNAASGAPSAILGVATVSANHYYAGPQLTVGSVPYMFWDTWRALTEDYATVPMKIARTLAADGLDVRVADVRACMFDGNSTEMSSSASPPYHPTNAGHEEISQCFVPQLMREPGPRVVRGTPASSSAACTPGETWNDGSYVYACIKSGQITRTALSSF